VSALVGRTVVVTRPREQAAPFAALLERHGARVVVFPTIVTRPADPAALDRAIAALETYAWVVFPSANAVRFVRDRLAAAGRHGMPAGVRVAAVGSATAALLEQHGIRVDAVPEEFVGTAVPPALGDLRGRRVLLPRADIGRAETVAALEAAGARVEAVTVYHTVPAEPDPAGLAALERGVDAVTFTSPSTFTNFRQLLGDRAAALLGRAVIASIGPVTSAAIRDAGLPVHVEPAEHTTAALAAALDTHFASHAAGVAGAHP
jgi:uroporphyrinogen III methyltransferase/synthase